MKKINKLIIALSLIIFTQGCTDSSPLISDEELAVIWGFVYAGEPISDIKINGTMPLDSDSLSTYPPINNADVAIIVNETRYQCELTSGDSGYYHYTENDLSIQTGDKVSIDIQWNDQFITAESTVPEPPTGINLNSNVMEIPDFNDLESFITWRQSENRDIIVNWEQELQNDWYYVTLESIELNPNPININAKFDQLKKKFVFPPIQGSTFKIRLHMLEYKGWHEIKVYRVNQEYVDLYESREQDSRDLNEPLTNIEGGLGVFSAFNSAKVKINVVQK